MTPRPIGGLRVFSSRDDFSGGGGDVMHYDVTRVHGTQYADYVMRQERRE